MKSGATSPTCPGISTLLWNTAALNRPPAGTIIPHNKLPCYPYSLSLAGQLHLVHSVLSSLQNRSRLSVWDSLAWTVQAHVPVGAGTAHPPKSVPFRPIGAFRMVCAGLARRQRAYTEVAYRAKVKKRSPASQRATVTELSKCDSPALLGGVYWRGG